MPAGELWSPERLDRATCRARACVRVVTAFGRSELGPGLNHEGVKQ